MCSAAGAEQHPVLEENRGGTNKKLYKMENLE